MKIMDSRTIAERLGLPEDVVRAVQRHGVLQRLDLDDAEVRERLWRAHCSSAAMPADRTPAAVDPAEDSLGLGQRPGR